ncbi:MAG TPA: hypothetical protein VGD65_13390 [Chryseosolibacter sp.]
MKKDLFLILFGLISLNVSVAQIDSIARAKEDSLCRELIREQFDFMRSNGHQHFGSLPTKGWYTETAPKAFGYGIPWNNVIDETQVASGIVIQNSLPKGSAYTDPNGNTMGYAIFFTRIINESASLMEVTMTFSADVFSPSPDTYLRLLLPTDTMTLDKVLLYDYGATGLKSFLDTSLNVPGMIRKQIAPKDDFLFYVVMLVHQGGGGPARAGLVVRDQNLFYKFNGMGAQFEPMLIPCGSITFRK